MTKLYSRRRQRGGVLVGSGNGGGGGDGDGDVAPANILNMKDLQEVMEKYNAALELVKGNNTLKAVFEEEKKIEDTIEKKEAQIEKKEAQDMNDAINNEIYNINLPKNAISNLKTIMAERKRFIIAHPELNNLINQGDKDDEKDEEDEEDILGPQSGGAIIMPSEYFGNDSGRYSTNVPSSYSTAYGPSVGVSQGIVRDGAVGPNLAWGPTSSTMQTGGRRNRRTRLIRNKKTVTRRNRRTRTRTRKH
jgi:hypothetical protein